MNLILKLIRFSHYHHKHLKATSFWYLYEGKVVSFTHMAVCLWLISVTFHYVLKSSFLFGYLEKKRLLKTKCKQNDQAAQVQSTQLASLYIAFSWALIWWWDSSGDGNMKKNTHFSRLSIFFLISASKAFFFFCIRYLRIIPFQTFLPVILKIKERKHYYTERHLWI